MNLKGSKILITGATGLVGGHVSERLLQSGAQIFAVGRSQNKGSYFFSQGLQRKIKVLKADILDYEAILSILKKNKIEYIFHLAAQLKVVTLHETFGINIMGLNNMLEAARHSPNLKGVIVASSNRAYIEGGISRQEMQKLPANPYDISKTSSDLIAQSYRKFYNLPILICRFGNVYGPGDLYNRIISMIVKKIISGETLELKASKEKRNYIYAGDVARGLVLACENFGELNGQAVNFAGRDSYSPLGLIKEISAILGKECKYRITGTMPHDIAMKKLKIPAAQKVLNWKPEISFKQGIAETYNWHMRQAKGQ